METKEALLDQCASIYQQIATLRRGMPIAEAKANSQYKKLEVRRHYLKQIQALDLQYKAIWAAIEAAAA